MAAPSFIAKGTISSNTTDTVTPSFPGSILAGDALFILVMSNQLGGSVGAINTPSGWTQVQHGFYTNSSPTTVGACALFYKSADGTETGSVAVTRLGDTGSTYSFVAQIYQYRGVNSVVGDSILVQLGDGNTTITWDGITIGGNERTLIAFVGQQTSSPPGTPATYTESATDSISAGPIEITLEANTKEDVSSDGSVTASGGSTNGWFTVHLAIFNPTGRSFAYLID